MKSPLPTLRGTLSQLQRAVAKFYGQIEERFERNCLIRAMWASMGHDLQVQVESLKKLPPSFWQALKNQEKGLARAASLVFPTNGDKMAGSLQSCLARTIDLEEPIILMIYAPLIRRLRSEWIELALDFYVMVKAHIARVSQSVQLFSGDPALSQRCSVLLQNFEREVQGPPAAEVVRSKKSSKKPVGAKKSTLQARSKHAKPSAKKTPVRALDRITKRAKPLVQKIEISRRRARR